MFKFAPFLRVFVITSVPWFVEVSQTETLDVLFRRRLRLSKSETTSHR